MTTIPKVVSSVGVLFLLLAVAQAVFTLISGGSYLGSLLDFVFIGLPGASLLYTGLWIPNSNIDRRYYPRIGGWLLGGVVVMYAFIFLRDIHPDVSVEWALGTQAIALTIGSIGGLMIGVQETQALIQRRQLEDRAKELTQQERELNRQNEQLEKFAKVVSHDLRNPLNVADGRLELAREECDSDHLEHVERAHGRMETLIEDLLTLAKQGNTVENVEPVPLRTMCERCWENVETGGVTLTVETDRTVLADPERLQQLLENLFRNAVEHGDGDVTVTIGTLSDDSGFYVEDDGPGIPPEKREQVFESGYSTATDGTGFGLSIVEEIVDAHGWSIAVMDSESGGARFEITDVELE